MATHYRVQVPNGHGGLTIYVDHVRNTPTRLEEVQAIAARIPGAVIESSPNGVIGWEEYAPVTPYLPPIIRNLKRATRTRYSVRDLDTLEVLGTGLTHDEADEIVYARQGTYSVVNETYRATYGDRGSETIVYYGTPTTPAVPIPPIPSYAPAHMFTYSVYSDGRFVGSCAGDAREELDALITARNGDAVTLDRFQEESTPSGMDI